MKPLPPSDLESILESTRRLWGQARGKRIFLSGATGFVGIWLLESLAYCNRTLGLDVRVVVLSRDPEKFRAKMSHLARESFLEFVEGDICSFPFPSGDFEFVIHGAAPTIAAGAENSEELLVTLIDGTRRMLSLAQSRGSRRVLFVSSGAVYGRQPAELTHLPEEYQGGPDWIHPDSAYAEGKRVAEQLCAIAARSTKIQLALARCFAFVGPHLPLDQHFAIGNFIGNALAGEPILIRGDGRPMRSYLYASDLAVWLWTLLLADPAEPANPAIVNVGSANAVSICELAQAVANALHPGLRIEIAEKSRVSSPPPRYVPDVRRAERWYGLRQTIGLDEAIRQTAAWHRS